VDALLDDPVFLAPFAPYFHPVIGPPSTPAECYLRLVFMKFRCQLGCNEALLARTAEAKLLRTSRLRADTTVVPASVACPTDSGLLAKAIRRRGRLHRAVNDLADLLEVTRRIVMQTRQRLAGITPDGASRRISLHDTDARPIARGRLGKPAEFGYKAQVAGSDDGIILDHNLEQGKGKPGQARRTAGHRRAFRRAVRWRTGCEGRISTLKRGYGWDKGQEHGPGTGS
jgi:IS5 family transposase